MRFTKMHGIGNDYIYVNCFDVPFPKDPGDLARRMADRHFGVGGDGLILICPSDNGADARMRMYNVDGSEAEMCGNGLRCVAKYVYDHGIKRAEKLRIQTGRGTLTVDLEIKAGKVDRVRVNMGQPILEAAQIPTKLTGNPPLDVPLTVAGQTLQVTCVSMGNPHCVTYVERATDDLVLGPGAKDRARPAVSRPRECRVHRDHFRPPKSGSEPGNAAAAKRSPAAPGPAPSAWPACSPAAPSGGSSTISAAATWSWNGASPTAASIRPAPRPKSLPANGLSKPCVECNTLGTGFASASHGVAQSFFACAQLRACHALPRPRLRLRRHPRPR